VAEEKPAEVTLVDEDGVERRFRLHDVFDFEGVAYYLVEAVDDPEQVLLLRERDGTLETVEGEEFDQVMAALEND
jgi:uncharacterized protein YrzB (UPF0473 family)